MSCHSLSTTLLGGELTDTPLAAQDVTADVDPVHHEGPLDRPCLVSTAPPTSSAGAGAGRPTVGAMPPPSLSPLGRVALAAGASLAALLQPRRADLVAAAGELTGTPALRALAARLAATPSAAALLAAAPPRFPPRGDADLRAWSALPAGRLGRAYADFMAARRFSADARPAVRWVAGRDAAETAALTWLMQRYVDTHDVGHVLTGLPTTVAGELGVKAWEAATTGLPSAAAAVALGGARLPPPQRVALWGGLVPWAARVGGRAAVGVGIPYEEWVEVPLDECRAAWGVELPPPELVAAVAVRRRR